MQPKKEEEGSLKRKNEEEEKEKAAPETKKAKVEAEKKESEDEDEEASSKSASDSDSDSDSDEEDEEEEDKKASGWEAAFKAAEYSKAFPLLLTEISREVGAKPFSLKKLEGTVLDKLEKAGGKKRKDLRKIFKKEVGAFVCCFCFLLAMSWFLKTIPL